ncbi:unnamed protein product [Eretmochelys imbricata]
MECSLVSRDGQHEPLALPDGVPVVLGRGPRTRVADKKCSRTQVELLADYKHRAVRVTQRGVNPTSVEELQLQPGDSSTLQEGADAVAGEWALLDFFSPKRHPPAEGEAGRPPKRPKAPSPGEEEEEDAAVAAKLHQLQETAASAEQAKAGASRLPQGGARGCPPTPGTPGRSMASCWSSPRRVWCPVPRSLGLIWMEPSSRRSLGRFFPPAPMTGGFCTPRFPGS